MKRNPFKRPSFFDTDLGLGCFVALLYLVVYAAVCAAVIYGIVWIGAHAWQAVVK